jgi:hypothetical protein
MSQSKSGSGSSWRLGSFEANILVVKEILLWLLLLADGEVNLNRIHLRNSRKRRRLANQIANLRHRPPGDPGDERADLRESQVKLRLLHVGLGSANRGDLRSLLLHVIVELALGGGTRFGQGCVAHYVDVGQAELRPRQLSFRLIERRLKGPGIDLKEDLAALDDRALPVSSLIR